MQRFDFSRLSVPEAYGLLTTVIAPRPIAFVSTLSPEGQGNLAPFSYFMLGGANPPSCCICPINNREGVAKDTLRNLEATGEYVVNICVREMAERVNQASYAYPYGVDEFDKAGLTRVASEAVRPPRVGESPLQLECRVHQIVRHGDGPLSSSYVIGEVLLLHADEAVLTDGLPDNTKINHIARLGGAWYAEVSPANLFPLPRPTEG